MTLKTSKEHYCLLCKGHKCRGSVHSEKPGVLKVMVKEYLSYTVKEGGNVNSIPLPLQKLHLTDCVVGNEIKLGFLIEIKNCDNAC